MPQGDTVMSKSTVRNHRQRGFTMAEILVTTAIFAVIMIAALTVYDRSNKVFKQSTEAADLQQSTRIGFEKLVSDLRMAGFDYSRGGAPTGDGEAPQPDEQIEYAGTNSVVFRANFNYNTSSANGNGLEPTYEPVNIKGGKIFPYVTTSNDEIIAYVLRSNDSSANTGSISFYVDDYQPRAAFPSTITPAPAGGSPSHPEEQVTIGGIDTTNDHPPYTLYRVTLADIKANTPRLGTPVAENIRSLNFNYYTDFAGATPLKAANGDPLTQGAIGGAGQYDPDHLGTTANFADRAQRALIASIRVNLVGMNANPDGKYTIPTETITSIKNYRQYALESLIVPRNLGLTGFPEPAYNPPAPPTIVGMCVGHCGAPVIYWQPPASAGDVTKYRVEWDINQTGSFSSGLDITDPSLRFATLPDDGISNVSKVTWYRMYSYNDNGRSLASSNYWSATPANQTKPGKVTDPQIGTFGTTNLQNQIALSWMAPANNVSPNNTLSCSGVTSNTGTDGTTIPYPLEAVHFIVYRGMSANFNPATEGVKVLDFDSTAQPQNVLGGTQVNWLDTAATSAYPPANCTSYYYRVEVADRCYKVPTYNVPPNAATAMSDPYPAVANSAKGPFQSIYSGAAPAIVPQLNVDKAVSKCPDLSAPTKCKIALNWTKPATDTATPANQIGIEWYVITRAWRIQAAGGSFTRDTLFGTNGQKEINCVTGTCASGGFSQQTPVNPAAFNDDPPFANVGGQALEYQYTVAAKNCSLYSGVSPNTLVQAALAPNPSVIFPGCTINPSIVESGGTGTAGGDTQNDPWVFGAGDYVTVTPPVGVTTQEVDFELLTLQGASVGGMSPDTVAPYIYTWQNQTDGQVYMLRITVTVKDPITQQTCSEVHIKYIQDESPAGCAIVPASVSGRTLGVSPDNGNGASAKVAVTDSFTLSNTTSEDLTLGSKNATFTWGLPAGDTTHTNLKMVSVVWASSTDNFTAITVATPAPAQTATTRVIPAGIIIPKKVGTVNGTLTVAVHWEYLKNDDCATNNCGGQNPYDPSKALQVSPLTKLCIEYTVPSETGVIKHCNVVGQAANTNNPTSCD
jgi:prepilin-type N-terminal cleavage/methylation domain-containing protein